MKIECKFCYRQIDVDLSQQEVLCPACGEVIISDIVNYKETEEKYKDLQVKYKAVQKQAADALAQTVRIAESYSNMEMSFEDAQQHIHELLINNKTLFSQVNDISQYEEAGLELLKSLSAGQDNLSEGQDQLSEMLRDLMSTHSDTPEKLNTLLTFSSNFMKAAEKIHDEMKSGNSDIQAAISSMNNSLSARFDQIDIRSDRIEALLNIFASQSLSAQNTALAHFESITASVRKISDGINSVSIRFDNVDRKLDDLALWQIQQDEKYKRDILDLYNQATRNYTNHRFFESYNGFRTLIQKSIKYPTIYWYSFLSRFGIVFPNREDRYLPIIYNPSDDMLDCLEYEELTNALKSSSSNKSIHSRLEQLRAMHESALRFRQEASCDILICCLPHMQNKARDIQSVLESKGYFNIVCWSDSDCLPSCEKEGRFTAMLQNAKALIILVDHTDDLNRPSLKDIWECYQWRINNKTNRVMLCVVPDDEKHNLSTINGLRSYKRIILSDSTCSDIAKILINILPSVPTAPPVPPVTPVMPVIPVTPVMSVTPNYMAQLNNLEGEIDFIHQTLPNTKPKDVISFPGTVNICKSIIDKLNAIRSSLEKLQYYIPVSEVRGKADKLRLSTIKYLSDVEKEAKKLNEFTTRYLFAIKDHPLPNDKNDLRKTRDIIQIQKSHLKRLGIEDSNYLFSICNDKLQEINRKL